MNNQTHRKKAILVLAVLTLLFILPAALAWFFYTNKALLPKHTTNHGQLLTPPVAMADLAFFNDQGQRLDNSVTPSNSHLPPSATRTNGKWLLLLVQLYCDDQSPGDAASSALPSVGSCERGLYIMRQIQRAVGKDRDRVQRAIVTYHQAATEASLTALLNGPYRGTLHLLISPQQLRQKLPFAETYIVDPLGNIVMYFSPQANPEDVLNDLEHLLGVSTIG